MLSDSQTDVSKLFNTVVKGGYCVGCGACAAVEGSPIKMKLNQYSKFEATIDADKDIYDEIKVQAVCPFSDVSKNENEIGSALFGKHSTYHNKIGYNIQSFAGYVNEGNFRDKGSSGGMGTWIAYSLFEKGLVDGIIHIKKREITNDNKILFHYQLSESLESIKDGAKSRYYPIELSEIIPFIKSKTGKYALIGVPCFVKAIRLLSLQDNVLNERIAFCIGLICGHLKTTRFAEMLGWQLGIEPSNLTSIDFRNKLEGSNANRYGVIAKGYKENNLVEIASPQVSKMYGTNWGLGFFKYKSCDYCDDVVAETADVTVGDAWLPQYLADSKGTNVIIVRNPIIQGLIEEARINGSLALDSITADEAAKSQKSGFDHRREGLAYRLFLADQKGQWRPQKREQPDQGNQSKAWQKRQILRMQMSELSHVAFNEALSKNSFSVLKKRMDPVIASYLKLYRPPVFQRLKTLIKKITNFKLLGE